jgi:hypothetical protein
MSYDLHLFPRPEGPREAIAGHLEAQEQFDSDSPISDSTQTEMQRLRIA